MIKRLVALTAVAFALTGATVAPALAAEAACLSTSITVNDTEAPTNGTNCVDSP